MSWQDCKIILNTTNGIFYTGDIVTGSVTLEFIKKQKIKVLTLKVKGTSEASWTRSQPTMPHIKIYSEKTEVFYIDFDIFGEVNGKTIQPGLVNIPFHFALPPDLPSSFKDSIARTYYRIIIQNKRAYNVEQKKVFPFIVMTKLNLNLINDNTYKVPFLYEVSTTFNRSKEFMFTIKTFKGVGSNQKNIPFEANIFNEKNVRITKIIVSLVQKLEYSVSSGYYNAEKKIHKLQYKDIKSSLRESFAFSIDIPQVPPSTINLAHTLINISYVYKVRVCFQCHLSLHMDVPVVIGTTLVSLSNKT